MLNLQHKIPAPIYCLEFATCKPKFLHTFIIKTSRICIAISALVMNLQCKISALFYCECLHVNQLQCKISALIYCECLHENQFQCKISALLNRLEYCTYLIYSRTGDLFATRSLHLLPFAICTVCSSILHHITVCNLILLLQNTIMIRGQGDPQFKVSSVVEHSVFRNLWKWMDGKELNPMR